jgi:hypothetical protein
MKTTPSELQALLSQARTAHHTQSSTHQDHTAESPALGFSTRVTAHWLSQFNATQSIGALLQRYGLGLALLLLLASAAILALTPTEQLTEEELLAARISQIVFNP